MTLDEQRDKLEALALHGGPGAARCVACRGEIKAREARWYGRNGATHARGSDACCRRLYGKDRVPYYYSGD